MAAKRLVLFLLFAPFFLADTARGPGRRLRSCLLCRDGGHEPMAQPGRDVVHCWPTCKCRQLLLSICMDQTSKVTVNQDVNQDVNQSASDWP